MMGIKEGWLGLGQSRRRWGAPRTRDQDGGAPNPDDDRPADADDRVRGERGAIPSVNREQSLQARVNNVVAIGAVLLVGGAFLFWYYGTMLAKNREAEEAAKQAAATKASGETKLPPLPRVDPPRLVQSALGPPPDAPRVAVATPTPLPQQQPPTPAELALLRRLTSPVLLAGGAGPSVPAAMHLALSAPPGLAPGAVGEGAPAGIASAVSASTDLGALLQPTATPAVRAQRLPTQRFLLPKGAFVDCTLETAVDSTLPGMTTCITAVDIFGADGQVVLLERGTKLVGETRGDVKQGQARVFVLWTEARTPDGIVIQLASPGTDALGRSGLPGAVDTHFWDRFGAAILLSLINGGIQAAVTPHSSGSGAAVIYNPQGVGAVMTEVLRNTINIPPTVVINQGARIQVLVARDADFRTVYALRAER